MNGVVKIMKNEGKKVIEQARNQDKTEIAGKESGKLSFEVDPRSVYKCVQCGTCWVFDGKD